MTSAVSGEISEQISEQIGNLSSSVHDRKRVTGTIVNIVNDELKKKTRAVKTELSQRYEEIVEEKKHKLVVVQKEKKQTESVVRSIAEGLVVVDAKGNVLGSEAKMLAASSTVKLSDSIHIIKQHNGLAIAAHLDRRSFSVISQLGMFPEDVGFDAIEISTAAIRSSRVSEFTSFRLPVIASSDSHFLDDVGICCTVFEIVEPTFCEVALAFKGLSGRRCYVA